MISFSDSGSERGVFAVVEVVKRQTIVIPVKLATVVATAGVNDG